MNGFHRRGRGISAHERASTIGKKIANWTVGNSMAAQASSEAGSRRSTAWNSSGGTARNREASPK